MLRSLAPLAALTLLACSGDKDPGTETGAPSVDVDLTVAPGPIPGIMIATVTTSEDAVVELEYGLEETILSHPVLGNGGTDHRFVVLGLKTDHDYVFEAVALASESSTRSDLVTAHTDPTVEDVPTFTVTTNDTEQTCQPDGFLLLTWVQGGNSGMTIVDKDGDIVWSVPLTDTDVQASRAQITHDGSGIVYTTADALRQDLVGEVVVQPIDGTDPTVTSTPTAHHDVVPLPDGNVAWLGYSFGDYLCDGGGTIEDAAVDTIEEATPGGSTTVLYDMFDDYPHPLDCSTGSSFFLPGRYDLTHSNSLMYRESDDAFFHMLRWHDTLIKVDRSSGDYQWQFGGTYSEFTPAAGQDPEDIFHHGHMSDIWNGGMMVFDNNDPGPSVVREYTIDEDAMTWEQAWAWDTGAFELLLGDIRRLPQPECRDHVLVTQSTSGVVREMLQDAVGTTVWMLEPEVSNTIVSRAEVIPDIYDLASAKLSPGR